MLSQTKIVHFDPMNTPLYYLGHCDLACKVYIYTGSTYAIMISGKGYTEYLPGGKLDWGGTREGE